MTYRRKFDKGNGSKSAARPDNLNDPVFNLGEFPVHVKNIERFMYIYDESRSEYQGHTIHNYDSGDGKKIDVTIPPEMISKMFAEIMSTEHPVLFHVMLRSDYRNRDRPNKIGKLIPKTMVLFNNKATQFGFNRLAQNISYHGCQLMTKNNVQPFKENRPGCLDTLYCKEMIDNLHGEVKTKKQSSSSSRSKPKYGKLGGGSMLLEDSDERRKLKSVMYAFDELVPTDVDENSGDEDDDDDSDDDDDKSEMDDDSDDDDDDNDDDDDDHQQRNERRKSKGKIAKKKKKKNKKKDKKSKMMKKEKKRVLPRKQQHRQQKQDEENIPDVEEVPPPQQRREVRKSTTEATTKSAEKRLQVVRGIAENSKKRKALSEQLESAVIPMNDIFGQDDKKAWNEHPKYQEFTEKASKYVDTLGFSQPKKGVSETMHSLARKLNLTLPSKMTPAKPQLTHAIVVEKLRSVDTTAALNYEWTYMGLCICMVPTNSRESTDTRTNSNPNQVPACPKWKFTWPERVPHGEYGPAIN